MSRLAVVGGHGRLGTVSIPSTRAPRRGGERAGRAVCGVGWAQSAVVGALNDGLLPAVMRAAPRSSGETSSPVGRGADETHDLAERRVIDPRRQRTARRRPAGAPGAGGPPRPRRGRTPLTTAGGRDPSPLFGGTPEARPARLESRRRGPSALAESAAREPRAAGGLHGNALGADLRASDRAPPAAAAPRRPPGHLQSETPGGPFNPARGACGTAVGRSWPGAEEAEPGGETLSPSAFGRPAPGWVPRPGNRRRAGDRGPTRSTAGRGSTTLPTLGRRSGGRRRPSRSTSEVVFWLRVQRSAPGPPFRPDTAGACGVRFPAHHARGRASDSPGLDRLPDVEVAGGGLRRRVVRRRDHGRPILHRSRGAQHPSAIRSAASRGPASAAPSRVAPGRSLSGSPPAREAAPGAAVRPLSCGALTLRRPPPGCRAAGRTRSR